MKDVAERITSAVNADDFLCLVQSDSNPMPVVLLFNWSFFVVLPKVIPIATFLELFVPPHIAQMSAKAIELDKFSPL